MKWASNLTGCSVAYPPFDWKPMPTIGKSVREIRVNENGQFRVIYLVAHRNAVFVLHAFRKKAQKTRKQDIEIARQRFQEIRKN